MDKAEIERIRDIAKYYYLNSPDVVLTKEQLEGLLAHIDQLEAEFARVKAENERLRKALNASRGLFNITPDMLRPLRIPDNTMIGKAEKKVENGGE